jgi:hypothetical protein
MIISGTKPKETNIRLACTQPYTQGRPEGLMSPFASQNFFLPFVKFFLISLLPTLKSLNMEQIFF